MDPFMVYSATAFAADFEDSSAEQILGRHVSSTSRQNGATNTARSAANRVHLSVLYPRFHSGVKMHRGLHGDNQTGGHDATGGEGRRRRLLQVLHNSSSIHAVPAAAQSAQTGMQSISHQRSVLQQGSSQTTEASRQQGGHHRRRCPTTILVGVDLTPDVGLYGPTNFFGVVNASTLASVDAALKGGGA